MADHLVIVESPSKAKTIQKYLGVGYVVEASYGHIRDLPEKGDGAVDVNNDFAMSYEVPDEKKGRVNKLRKLAKQAKTVWLATDKDREGEAISWHLMDELQLPPDKVRRVVFNEITKKAIQAAFANPGRIDMDKVAAQEARRALDRLVGYPVSDLVRRKVSGAKSAGRVQTVAVRIIVEREREIRSFVPTAYVRIGAVLSKQENSLNAQAAYDAFLAAHRAQMAELASGVEAEPTAETATDGDATKAAEPESEEPAAVTGASRRELDALLRRHSAFRAELVQFGQERIANTADAVKDRRGLILSPERATAIVELLRRESFAVASIEKKERADRPRPPFTTATLQQAASSQLRFGAKKTMSLAQRLYEGVDLLGEGSVALITYMRTDSTYLSDQAVEEGRKYIAGRFGADALPDRPNRYAPKADAQGAHEAIRPTEPARTPDALAETLHGSDARDLLALYRLIWTRFIACQMKPAIWNVTEVTITAGSADRQGTFRTSGRELKEPGYTALTGVSDDGDQLLPPMTVTEQLSLLDLADTRHVTQPPPRFTEAGLVKELERQGIGRPSTYANIIQVIQDRNYVQQCDRKFLPTVLGEVVVDRLTANVPQTFEVGFTRDMESRLDDVESGRKSRVELLREFWKPFEASLEKAKNEMPFFSGKPTDIPCEKCGAPMLLLITSGRPFLGCSRYNKDDPDSCDHRVSTDDFGRVRAKARETEYTCDKCGRPMVLRTTARARAGVSYFLGCTGYGAKENPCENTRPADKDGHPLELLTPEKLVELDIRCPECGSPTVIKFGRFGAYLGCSATPACKQYLKVPEGYYVPKPPPQLTGIFCELCKRELAVRTVGSRKFLGCTGYPKCRNAKPYELFESGFKGVAPKSARTVDHEERDQVDGLDTGDADAAVTGGKSANTSPRKAAKKAGTDVAAAQDNAVHNKHTATTQTGSRKSSPKTAAKKSARSGTTKSGTTKSTAKKSAKSKSHTSDDSSATGDMHEDAVFTLEGTELPRGGDSPATDRAAAPPAVTAANGTSGHSGSASLVGAPFEAGDFAQALPASASTISQSKADTGTDGEWGNCPDCDRPLALKRGNWGPFLACTGFPKCKKIVSLKGEAKARAAEQLGAPPPKAPPVKTDVPCPKCSEPMVVRRGKGRPFLGCSRYPKCDGTRSDVPDTILLAGPAEKKA